MADLVVAKGFQILGKVKFNLKNKEMFDIAVKAFNKYSDYKNNAVYLNYFLQTLSITSPLEGGFDSCNTYDRAGASFGFIQFSNPKPKNSLYIVLSSFNKTLADELSDAFGDIMPFSDAKSLLARQDNTLIKKVQKAMITNEGIEAQFKSAIENYYDKAFAKFLTLKFSPEYDNSGPFGSKKEKNEYRIYACAFIFDVCVNQGAGKLNKIQQITTGSISATEGLWLNIHTNNIYLRPERKEYWQKIIDTKFTAGSVFG